MSLLRILTLLVAAALSFAPVAMERAMAAMPSGHAQMASDHCEDEDSPGDDTQRADDCCNAACASVAVVPLADVAPARFGRPAATRGSAAFRREILSEIATPPPRRA